MNIYSSMNNSMNIYIHRSIYDICIYIYNLLILRDVARKNSEDLRNVVHFLLHFTAHMHLSSDTAQKVINMIIPATFLCPL